MKIISRLAFSIFLLISLFGEVLAQIPQVPAEMEFADMIIRINPQARREIQLDVDALYRSPKHFQIKLDRVRLYMPFVEREFQAVGVPLDLKYLVIQESGLIADAVSTSNAVGFWQFKQGTAEEVFLQVDRQIDDRKNIVNSSRGAALYLKKHNASFDNWMCALVSYQMGLGGAKAYFGNKYNGKRIVDIDRNSHWYFKKFLAHKVAFENQLTVFTSSGSPRLVEVKVQGPTSLSALAQKYKVSEDHLQEMNKWTSNGKIPAGRAYSVVFVSNDEIDFKTAIVEKNKPNNTNTGSTPKYSTANSYPRIAGNTSKASQPDQITVNELDGVQANKTTTQANFADQIGIKEKKFRRLNDLEAGERIEAGEYYYTEKKKAKAEVATHIVQPGETLWSISQKYGIKLSSLKAKNRIRRDQDLKAGMVLNLQEHRKRGEDIPIVPIQSGSRDVVAKNNTAPTPSRTVQASNSSQASSQSGSSLTHVVSPGDTLYAISKKYGVSVEQIKTWNRIGNQNIISVGQKLTIFKP
ncbi:LysM peptidoglycan-binding domain-containing protein [Algoriphagus limi]|uniref:LysM peptidoglycan-binding domain-containing protein n=1 Tax=Algoriphagus limi TaxID=2975273 RepID=A0ABT2G903_9BACT|nr:LysM peptidoglycan-binding domain-containing protein [Algoriphagus limi]MCS5491684.1 LysM peptidoglycan-binding domain-containing protein [Algoriphagus limi]